MTCCIYMTEKNCIIKQKLLRNTSGLCPCICKCIWECFYSLIMCVSVFLRACMCLKCSHSVPLQSLTDLCCFNWFWASSRCVWEFCRRNVRSGQRTRCLHTSPGDLNRPWNNHNHTNTHRDRRKNQMMIIVSFCFRPRLFLSLIPLPQVVMAYCLNQRLIHFISPPVTQRPRAKQRVKKIISGERKSKTKHVRVKGRDAEREEKEQRESKMEKREEKHTHSAVFLLSCLTSNIKHQTVKHVV